MSETIDRAPATQAELLVLLDKQAITEVLTRYLRAIDRGDIATLRASYLPGATEEHGGLFSGSAQGYIDTIEAGLQHPRSVGTHTLSNVLVEVDGDAAQAEHYVLAMTRARAADGAVKDSLIASRIIDDLERVDGRWAISRRRLRFDWSHDLGPRPDRWLWGRLDPADLLHGSKFPNDPVYDGITTAPRSTDGR